MAMFETVLPALRAGKKVRREWWGINHWIEENETGYAYLDEQQNFAVLSPHSINADDWEVVPEPKRVADYFVPTIDPMFPGYYRKKTYEVGTQPHGAVLVPGSERTQED